MRCQPVVHAPNSCSLVIVGILVTVSALVCLNFAMAREQTTLSRFFTITEPPKKAARKESYQPTRKTLQNETEEPVRTNTLEDSPDHGGFARASNNSSAAVESASAEGTEQRQSGLSCVGVGEERVEEEGQARDETGGDVSPVQRTGELAEKLTTVEAGEGRPNVVEPGEGRPPYKLTPLESQACSRQGVTLLVASQRRTGVGAYPCTHASFLVLGGRWWNSRRSIRG